MSTSKEKGCEGEPPRWRKEVALRVTDGFADAARPNYPSQVYDSAVLAVRLV
jgi:hypothetical protein